MLQKDKVILIHMLWWRQEILLLSWFFQDSFSGKDLLLGISTLYVTRLRLIVVFVSLPSFTLPVELVLCLFPSCPIYHSLYFFIDFLNACDDIPFRQIRYTGNLHAYNRQLKKGMIWCKEKNPLLTKSVHSYKISKSFFLRRNSCCCHSIFTSMVRFSLILSTDNISWSRVRNVKNLR